MKDVGTELNEHTSPPQRKYGLETVCTIYVYIIENHIMIKIIKLFWSFRTHNFPPVTKRRTSPGSLLKSLNLPHRAFYCKNKPSFCSGSCDEIHANLSNKTSLKHSWNTIKLSFSNSLLTPSELFKIPLNHPLIFLETTLQLPWNALRTSLKQP